MPWLAHSAIWQSSTESRRLLSCMDVLASVTTLVIIAVSATRLDEAHRSTAPHNTHSMALHPLITSLAILALYAAAMLLPLGVMLARPDLYARWRLTVCLAIRLLRLWVLTSFMWASHELDDLAAVITDRALGHGRKPLRALFILLVHPVCFFCQQALFVLPFWLVLPIQLLSTVNTLHYSLQYLCALQPLAGAAGMDGTLREAQQLCGTVQAWASLITIGAVGDVGLLPPVPQGPGTYAACEGVNAVHVLQVFLTICLMLWLPCAATYELDRWLTSCQQQRTELHAAAAAAAAPGSSSSGSSSGTWHAGGGDGGGGHGVRRRGSTTGSAGQGQGAPVHEPFGAIDGPTMRSSGPGGSSTRGGTTPLAGAPAAARGGALPCGECDWHSPLLCMCIPVVLALTWQLSEVLGELFAATLDCGLGPAAGAGAAAAGY